MSDGIHVIQQGDLWAVTRGNYTLDEFSNELAALQLARQRAKNSRARVILHAEDGSVRIIENYSEGESDSRLRKRRTA